MEPLEHTMEAQFAEASNIAALRKLYEERDYIGLLEYAMLLAQAEAYQRSQIRWLILEACRNPSDDQARYETVAAELLRRSGRDV